MISLNAKKKRKVRSIEQLQAAGPNEILIYSPDFIQEDLNRRIERINSRIDDINSYQATAYQDYVEASKSFQRVGRGAANQRSRLERSREAAANQEIDKKLRAYHNSLDEESRWGAGNLLVTDALYNHGSGEPRKWQNWSKPLEKHPLVSGIKAREAVRESLTRTKDQIRSLVQMDQDVQSGKNKEKHLKTLVKTNPLAVAKILMRQPQLAGQICRIAKAIQADQQRNENIERVFMVAGVGAMVAFAQPAGLSVAEGVYLGSQTRDLQRETQSTINAFLARTGGQQGAAASRQAREALEEKSSELATFFGFAAVDLIGVIPASELGQATRRVRDLERLQGRFQNKPRFLNKIEDLKAVHGTEYSGQVLFDIANLSSDYQSRFVDA